MMRNGTRRPGMLRAVLAAWAAAVLPHAVAAQGTPPPPSPASPPLALRLTERTLPNGLRVVVAEQHDVPLVAAQVVVRAGAEADPDSLGGLASLVAGLVPRGTESRPRPQVTQALILQGTPVMTTGAEWDLSRVTVVAAASRFPAVAEILAESVLRPAFAEQEVRGFGSVLAQQAQDRFNDPAALAEYAAARLVYGTAAYGRPVVGTPESLARITRDDVVRFYQTHYRPDNAVLVLTGDIRPDSAFALAERLFGGWARPSAPLPAAPAVRAAPAGPSAVLVNVPDMLGASLVVAQPGVGLGDADYFRALVASTVLGGGYTSRLSRTLRVERPLAEDLRTWVDARRGGGLLYAAAGTDSAASAPEIASALAGGFGSLTRGMAADSELVLRRGFVVAQLARDLQTVEGLANRVGAQAARGAALDRLTGIVGELQGVRPADVRRFAGAHAGGARVVVVGDARLMQAELRRRFPDLEVIYFEELDLGQADLRR